MESISGYKQLGVAQKEGGGIFLGNQRGNNLEVVDATVPERGDRCGRYYFQRISKSHQNKADQLWERSGFTITYLGEWHTHPEKIPEPSHQDISEWKEKLNGYDYPLILVIIGQEKNWLGSFYLGEVNTLCLI